MIRELFAATPDARERGYKAGRFSFNVSGGGASTATATASSNRDAFLPDIFVPCEVCGGRRYNRETLEVRYKGKISEVLDMTIEEACEFFSRASVYNKLKRSTTWGSATSSSGSRDDPFGRRGAARQIATELSRRSTGKTCYILDEPTTGLHSYDVDKLVKILQRLRGAGNTVIVIEHNLDVIKVADHIIDLGPREGTAAARSCEGTPEQSHVRKSYRTVFKKILYKESALKGRFLFS